MEGVLESVKVQSLSKGGYKHHTLLQIPLAMP